MQNLHWSRYNFLVKTKDNTNYLYNSYSNCLIRADEALFSAFRTLSDAGELNDESLFSEDELEYLKKCYVLTEDDDTLVEILHTHSMARLFSRKTLVLTVAPTRSCNFACTYCFEKWRRSSAMTDETEERLCSLS